MLCCKGQTACRQDFAERGLPSGGRKSGGPSVWSPDVLVKGGYAVREQTNEVGVVVLSEQVSAGDDEQLVLTASAEALPVERGRVLIAPWGQVNSSNGEFLLDEEAGRMVAEAFAAHGTDVPIDYEHQSLGGKYASPSGQAPAAGWIKALRLVTPGEAAGNSALGTDRQDAGPTEDKEVDRQDAGPTRNLVDLTLEPGLYAEVEWTESARAKLAAREYRYLSPVVIVRKRDRRVVALHSAALTNKPAIVGMKPIVNSERRENVEEERDAGSGSRAREEDTETRGRGDVAREASDRLALAASERESAGSEAVEVLRLRLGLEEGSDSEAVIVAADQRLSELMQAVAEREAEERVDGAVRAGKLIPAQREWALSLALRDAAGFDEWAATAPVVVSLGRTEPPTSGRAGRNRTAVVNSAKAAYRAEPSLALLTSESAWVQMALREAGVEE